MMVWYNGSFHETEDGLVSLSDRGILLGDGVFETLLVQDGEPVFFAEHMTRFRQAAEVLKLPLPVDPGSLRQVVRDLVHRHEKKSQLFSARITLTRGPGVRGIGLPPTDQMRPSLFVTVAPAGPASEPAPETAQTFIASHIRRNETSPAARLKTANYLDNILARDEAKAAGADEALMLNSRGAIACATIANVFLFDGDALITPDMWQGILPGITRAKVLECAEEAGIPIREGAAAGAMLQTCPVFFTNSLMGLVPALRKEKPVAMNDRQEGLFVDLKARYAKKVEADVLQARDA